MTLIASRHDEATIIHRLIQVTHSTNVLVQLFWRVDIAQITEIKP